MTYILLVVFYAYGSTQTMATAEFNNEQACEAALRVVKSSTSSVMQKLLVCLPKGGQHDDRR